MACKFFKYTVLFFLLFSSYSFIKAQSLQVLENEYETLKINLKNEKLILDSLLKSLNDRARLIEEEKSKPKPDQDKVYKLMAGSATIANSIKMQQETILQLEKRIELVRQKLDYHYTLLIDSLKSLKQIGSRNVDERSIDKEILNITEKRLLIMPQIKQLSFNPEKILEIDLSKAKDSLQKKIFIEYLTSALSEVNSLINQVNETSREIAQIIKLQAKAKKFLEDVEFESQVKQLGTTSKTSTVDDLDLKYDDRASPELNNQLRSFLDLNNQLNFRQPFYVSKSGEKFLSINKDQISLKDYQQLLRELEKRLIDFRTILSDKLNNR